MFTEIINKVIPINLIFFLGYVLKRTRALDEHDGKVFLKTMFYVCMPSLLFQSIRKTDLKVDYLLYPIVIILFQLFMFVLGKLITDRMNISEDKKIVIRGALIIINSGFVTPFFIAFKGVDNIWRMGLYDFGNAMVNFLLVYSMFFNLQLKESVKLLRSAPILAMILGVIVGLTGIKIPDFMDVTLTQLGTLVGPTIMLGMGLYFTPSFENFKLSGGIVILKSVIGIIIGLIVMRFLPFDELSKKSFVYMTTSPVGANILTFSVLSRIDTKLPSEIVSLSILLNLILVPLIFIFL
jgi:predicted permease